MQSESCIEVDPAAADDPCGAPATVVDPIPTVAQLSAYAQERALRLSLKDLQDPAVQAKLAAHRAMDVCRWGRREETLAALATQHGVTSITIRRWLTDVDKWRVAARLPSVQMLDTAIDLPRAKSFDQAAMQRGIEIYAGNIKAGQLAAYARLADEASAAGWRVGCYTSFSRALGKIPERIWEWISKGETGFELGVVPKIVRAWLSVPVYSVLCGDQNIVDYNVVRSEIGDCQVFDPATGEIYSPEFYLWMDCTSRAWTGLWPAWGHYSRYTVGISLREACRIRLPQEIYTDWGKPECSWYVKQIVEGLKGHCATGDWGDYGGRWRETDIIDPEAVVHRKTSIVGTPWVKPIENQMNVLKRGLLDRNTPGFRQRLKGDWENDTRQAQLKRDRLAGRLLTTEEFLELVRDVADAHNREACQIKESPVRIIPAEVLTRGLEANPGQAYDDLTLDLIFQPRFTRTPRQGLVRVTVAPGDERHYEAPELGRINPGERVQVSVDPFDLERPAVLTTLHGDYIGLAEPWLTQQPDDKAGLTKKIKQQMALMKWWRAQVRTLKGTQPAAVPRIAAVTKTARAAAASEAAKPDKGAAKRADRALIERFSGGK